MRLFVELDNAEVANAFKIADAVFELCKDLRLDEKAVAQMMLIQSKSEAKYDERAD
jgi:hypothetical protein